MALKIWEVSHDNYESSFYTSARKAYNSMINNGTFDEWGEPNQEDVPSFAEAKKGARYGGYRIQYQYVL